MDINNNFDKVIKELEDTGRDGIAELITFLGESDFKTAPASTKFHLNVEGGLAQHSLNVLRFARSINKGLELELPEDSITIAALLHDLCKVGYYELGEEWDKEWKDKTNQWRKKAVWKVKDQLPLGHGEKSVIMASQHFKLTECEMLAIRWHMAFSDPGTHFGYPSGSPFRESLNEHELVKVIMLADQMAETYETNQEKKHA